MAAPADGTNQSANADSPSVEHRALTHVVWPKSPRGIETGRLAPRLDHLEGARVAFLWDYLFRGDELFPVLEQALTERFAGIAIVGYDTFGNSHGGDEATWIAGLPDALASRHIDAVVSGMGC